MPSFSRMVVIAPALRLFLRTGWGVTFASLAASARLAHECRHLQLFTPSVRAKLRGARVVTGTRAPKWTSVNSSGAECNYRGGAKIWHTRALPHRSAPVHDVEIHCVPGHDFDQDGICATMRVEWGRPGQPACARPNRNERGCVCESALANKVTSWSSWATSSLNHAIARSVPP